MLHRRVFAGGSDLVEYRKYLADVFLHPAGTNPLSSLVYERGGSILGFLGVVPRLMRFNGQSILAAVCSQFVVDPSQRGVVGLQMLKRCFSGGQDLSLTDEASDNTRKVWEWCGGSVVLPSSVHWIRPLRPAQTLAYFTRQTRLARFVWPFASLTKLADAIVSTRMAGSIHRQSARGFREELDETSLSALLPTFAASYTLTADGDTASLARLFQRARERAGPERLRSQLIKDTSGTVLGWFIYAISHDQIGEVLQLAAAPHRAHDVLAHLVEDAWERGVIAVSGRLTPAFAPALSEKQFLLYRRGHWMLVHSQRQELTHALQRGDAFVSRLEGEWCLRFR